MSMDQVKTEKPASHSKASKPPSSLPKSKREAESLASNTEILSVKSESKPNSVDDDRSNENLAKLNQILLDRPKFHKGETEIQRQLNPEESYLPTDVARRVSETESTHYGVAGDVAHFLFSMVESDWKTLEVGLGVSTLSIALKGAQHTCVTPANSEIEAISVYAKSTGISLEKINFVAESSDDFLPNCNLENLDLVMIDGKHAFPFPIVDWFFTAERLKTEGIMVIDDVEMKSVSVLTDFLDADPRWEKLTVGSDKTYAYKKLSDTIHDVAWHMQPYVFNGTSASVFNNASLIKRAVRKIRRTINV